MAFQVVANVTGEPARVQKPQGRESSIFTSRGEAEAFQRSLRLSGFDRVDIITVQEEKPVGTITAPASTPDVRGGKPVTTIESATGEQIPITGLTQGQINKLLNIEKGIAEGKIKSSQRETLRQQVISPERFKAQPRKPKQRVTTKEEIQESLFARQKAKAEEERIAAEIGVPSVMPEDQFVPTKLEKLEADIEAQKRRQREFAGSEGFKRIERVAGVITGGRGVPIEERGFVGRTGQAFARDILSFPIAIGGTIAGAAEKGKLTLQALATPGVSKRDIAGEIFVGAPKRVVSQFKELPPSEKLATGLFIAAAPFLGGGAVRGLVGKRVTAARAIKELPAAKRAKLERFELSATELKGIKTKPKELSFEQVERLSPAAARAVKKKVIRQKEEVVVGGSVAQALQIREKSRVPVDIDLFVKGDTKQFVRELAGELREAGVERVSAVKGKQITIKGKKAIEVKPLSLLEQNIRKVQLPFQRVSSAFIKTPEGVRILGLSAQAERKIIGGFGLERERIRAKDITDLPDILRQLRKSKAGSLIRRQSKGLKEPRVFGTSGGVGDFPGRGEILFPSDSFLSRPKRRKDSLLTPSKGAPSVITPSPPSGPSLITPTPSAPPSIITPSPPSGPSLITPTPSAPPSIITPTTFSFPPVQPPRKKPSADLDFDFESFLGPSRPSAKKKKKRKFKGTPSLSVVGLGKFAAGTKLTRKQLRGEAEISPFLIRKV